MVCSWLLQLCRHDDIKNPFWDIKTIWKQILLSTNRGYSKHLLTCSGLFGKQADLKSRTQHAKRRLRKPEPAAGSCCRWFESTIRRRGFSRRHMRSRLMFAREKEENTRTSGITMLGKITFNLNYRNARLNTAFQEKILVPTPPPKKKQ